MNIDTAALTGEPFPRKCPYSDYVDAIINGTTVRAGECNSQVMATGTNTEIGQATADVFNDKSVGIMSLIQQKIMLVVQILISFSLLMVLAVVLVQGKCIDHIVTDLLVYATTCRIRLSLPTQALSIMDSKLTNSEPFWMLLVS